MASAFVSAVSGSSALLVFSFFPVYLMYLSGFHSYSCAPVPLLNMFSSYVSLGRLSQNRSLGGDISLVV